MATKKTTQTATQKLTEETLAKLAELGGKHTAEEDITFEGTKFILPESMTLKDAFKFLASKAEEEERQVDFSRIYKYRPWDGARATANAIRRVFGALNQVNTTVQTMFGTEEYPPQLITIPISPNDTEQVPWGTLVIPHLPKVRFELGGVRDKEYGQLFRLSASGPKKYRHHIEGVFRVVQDELENNSLYRGKAFDGKEMADFLDLSGVDPNKVIYANETMRQLDANIWALLRYPDQMSELGVPLKRAVLLEGPYGTGKTLAAFLTAREATANGWSFLMCRPGRDNLFDVMATARLYQPAVVFFEDVDSIADTGSDHVQQLLDVFDGIQAKGTRIICVLTTNHVEKIHKGMVRPGRLDAVIHIGKLDAAGIQRMVVATVPSDLLDPDIEWELVTGSMEGFLPAFCREAIDRTVRYNVSRNQGVVSKLGTMDFVDAANGLRPQLELMEGAKDRKEKVALNEAFIDLVGGVVDRTKLDTSQQPYTLKVSD